MIQHEMVRVKITLIEWRGGTRIVTEWFEAVTPSEEKLLVDTMAMQFPLADAVFVQRVEAQ